jgi:integrase
MVEKRERRRRDGSTYTVWRVRWYDETGAERSKTFDRATDAKAFEAKIRTLKRTGALADVDAGRETLAEFVDEWWMVYAGPNLERATLRAYASLWNGHARPRLGQLQLRELTPQTIARFRAELEAAGVGVEAIRKTMTMLQGVLQRTVEWGWVPTNAVKITRKPPKPHRPAVQAIPPTLIELMRARLLEQDKLRDATLLAVLAYAGLRPQEALALEWRHVRERTLLVERALSDGQLKALKNRRQPRTVELLAPSRDDLATWRAAQGAPPATAPVFPSHSGAFWRASDWRN